MQASAYQSTEVTGRFDKKYNEQSLRQFTSKQKSRKKWLIGQPVSNTNMMVDSGSVSMPLNLSMVATPHADFSFALRSRNAKKYSSRIPIFATKGCPIGCNLCTTPTIYGKNYRYRDIDFVLDEMRYYQDRLDKEKVHFSFMDDNISFHPSYLTDRIENMAKLGIRWNANISMNFLHKPETAKLAGRSGCDLMSIGFESLNPKTLKSVHKGSNRLAFPAN